MGCRRYSAASRLEVLLDGVTFDLFDELLNSECSASFTTACDNPGTLKSMSSSSVDSCPPTGLTILDNWVVGWNSLCVFAASSDF